MISGTIYTEPESGCEILILDDQDIPFGAAYHPRRAGDAIPWHAGCDHCRHGRQPKINIHLKRALLTMSTRKLWSVGDDHDPYPVHECKIASTPTPYTVRHWNVDNDHYANIDCPSGKTLRAELPENRPFKIKGEGEKRSLALHRGLRLLFSARPATLTEIYAVASFFLNNQKRSRLLCDKIEWSVVLARSTPPKENQDDGRIPTPL